MALVHELSGMISLTGLALVGAVYVGSTTPQHEPSDLAHEPVEATVDLVGPAAGESPAPDQQDCIARAVYWEARGASPAGMLAVAQVIHNRARHPSFPQEPCAVVRQRVGGQCQFTWFCSLGDRRPPENEEWQRAVWIASLSYSVPDLTGGATFFQASAPRRRQTAYIDGHSFYR